MQVSFPSNPITILVGRNLDSGAPHNPASFIFMDECDMVYQHTGWAGER
jgi:hypothetical protein